MPKVDVIIRPVCLRFRYHADEIVYMFAAGADQQLDGMEQMLGIGPGPDPIFDTNLGFLPVASTTLIRGERTLLVDPGNHHIGAYSIIDRALASRGVTKDDVDAVVTTHTHSDHAGAIVKFVGKPWILGAGELAEMELIEGPQLVAAKKAMMGEIIEIAGDEPVEIMPGVRVVRTPGHTAGHMSLLVETDDGLVLVAGDQTMTRSEYEERRFSQWYGPETLALLNASLDKVQAFAPALVIPGHEPPFRPRR